MSRQGLILAAPLFFATVGCQAIDQLPGISQSIGHLPGIDPTDYAYTNYKCYTTQVYPQNVPQVQSSALEAMRDLGFSEIKCESKPGVVVIRARTVDGLDARIIIKPRNAMSSMAVKIGPFGDEMAAQALIQRVALNFGALPRTIIPLEPTLSRRIDPRTLLRPDVPPVELLPAPPDNTLPLSTRADRGPFAPSEAK